MSLKALAKSLRQGEILLPRLRRFLAQEQAKNQSGQRKAVVVADAKMTIACFKERLTEYNHDTELEVEYFHPSRISSCLRDLWFSHHHAPKDSSLSGTDLLHESLIFETGTYMGVMFQNLCERAGLLTRREIAIQDPKNKILGHADGELLIDETYYILEIKSINSRGFTQLGSSPNKAHLRQTMAYCKSLGRKWGIIVYLEKDRHQIKEFVVPFSEKFFREEVASRINAHFSNLKKLTPPDREGEAPSLFPCRYCSHTRVCFGSGEMTKFLNALKHSKDSRK